MSDKIIIELELLTPLKYKESIYISNTGWGVVLEIREVYKAGNYLKNTYAPHNIGRPSTLIDIEQAEECLLIESSELHERKFKEHIEFKGFYKLEGQYRHICSLVYIVKNPNKEVENVLDKGVRSRMKYYVKKFNIDQETVDVFGDMYGEL